jgi:hypothetical protein
MLNPFSAEFRLKNTRPAKTPHFLSRRVDNNGCYHTEAATMVFVREHVTRPGKIAGFLPIWAGVIPVRCAAVAARSAISLSLERMRNCDKRSSPY